MRFSALVTVLTNYYLGVAALLDGRLDDAHRFMRSETSEDWRRVGLALTHHAREENGPADHALERLLKDSDRIGPYRIALVLAFRGDLDATFEWLDKAAEHADPLLAEVVGDPVFDNARSDPRWSAFLDRIGRSPQALASIEFDVPAFIGGTH